MVTEGRIGRRGAKEDDNGESRSRANSDKGVSTSSTAGSGASGLRRSVREPLSAKKEVRTPSPSAKRKSERIVKLSAKTPSPGGKKSTLSPLRRSVRVKGSSSGSSGGKNVRKSLGSEVKKQNRAKKVKSVSMLNLETEEIHRSEEEEEEAEPVRAKKQKRVSDRYKEFFTSSKKKLGKTGSKKKKTRGGRTVGSSVDQDKESEKAVIKDPIISEAGFCTPTKELEDGESGKVSSSLGMKSGCEEARSEVKDDHVASPLTVNLVIGPENVLVDCSEVEKEKESEDPIGVKSGQGMLSVKSPLDALTVNLDIGPENVLVDCLEVEKEKETEDPIGVKSGQGTISSSRKRIMLDASSETSEADPSKRICTSSLSSNEKQRAEVESRKGLASCSSEDREEHEATIAEKCDNLMQKKESLENLQTVDDQNTCFTCKRGGKLLCCDGKGCTKSFHLSCLDPPMDDDPLGVWYCLDCVKKKLESGVYSVSKGIESIWDSKEESILDVDGWTEEKCFFVKYKGLAHIHNVWIPESKLLLEAPSLAKLNRKSQAVSWKQEWTVPHRLLQKRLLGKNLEAFCEWLVKWRGLNYEHATWELDNSSFFNSPEGQALVKDYENRRKRITELGNCSSEKSSHLLPGTSCGSEIFQDYVNKLHEFWRKTQNAVVIDEHANERIPKMISLVQSFQTNPCGPFLIIASSTTLRSWDDEFLHLAPSLNFVIYKGNKNLRKSIQNVEFPYLEVLITTLEIVMEDLNVLRNIQWGVIIIDELPCVKISSHSAQINLLTCKRKLLVVSSQLKENAAEYRNLLSLLEEHHDSPNIGSNDNIAKLKEKLSKHIVCSWKPDFSRFKEYWVPIQMSSLQVEQYCATLIRNTGILCSANKHDSAGGLRDVLRLSRKCCDHPYIVDKNTLEVLSKAMPPIEYLEFGIKASGKFQFLDVMLMEMKKKSLRVLILFHELGKDSIGDILDDHLSQKFGPDSFERVETGIQPSKKQTALNKFNNKEIGRFVFLLEARACFSSIKLSSIDTVIIFGSDWNPMNDLRALQKITIDSPAEQIPVFRLYTTFTLEEKILSLAKQGRIIENNVQNILWSTSHRLLMWGASYQFRTLDKFHRDNIKSCSPKELISNTSSKESVEEILQIISSNESKSSSIILNVEKVGGAYQSESSLPGELDNQGMEEGKPHIFWTKLLEGKHFQWKYLSCSSSQRNRKKVKYCETDSASNETSSEAVKKRRKVVKEGDFGNESSPISPTPRNRPEDEDFVSTSHPLGDNFSEVPSVSTSHPLGNSVSAVPSVSASQPLGDYVSEIRRNYKFDTKERRNLRVAQNSLHLSLKPEILELCKLFKLTGNVEALAIEFLEYMLNNHHVNSDSPTTMESFQISMCWAAASMLNLKIDHRESVALAKQHRNFKCRKEEVEFAYSMLKCFKMIFSYRTGKLLPNLVPSSEPAPELLLAETDVLKSISQIKKKFEKKLSKLIEIQVEEKKKVMSCHEEEKSQIENSLKKEKVVIGSCYEDRMSLRLDKLKVAGIFAARKLEKLERKRDALLKDLEAKHVVARRVVQQRGTRWVGTVKAWARQELFGKTHVGETLHWLELDAEEEALLNGIDNSVPDDEQSPEDMSLNAPEKDVKSEVVVTSVSSDEELDPNSGHECSEDDQIADATSESVAVDLKTEENGVTPAQQNGETVSPVPESSERVDCNTENNGEMPAQQDRVNAADGETESSVPESSEMIDHDTAEGNIEMPAQLDRINAAADGETHSSVPESSQRADSITEEKENGETPAQQYRETLSPVIELTQRVESNTEEQENGKMPAQQDRETLSPVIKSPQRVDNNTEEQENGEAPAQQDRETLSPVIESSQRVDSNTEEQEDGEMPAQQDGETLSPVLESSQRVESNTEEKENGEVPAQQDKVSPADGETLSPVTESSQRVSRDTEEKENDETPAQQVSANAADGEPESSERVDRNTEDGEMPAQLDIVNTAAEDRSSLQELSPVDSSSVVPATALDDSDAVPPHQAVQEDLALPPLSTEAQVQDAPPQTNSSEAENPAVPPSYATLWTEEIERLRNDHQVPIAPLVSNQPTVLSSSPSLLLPNGTPIGPSTIVPTLPYSRLVMPNIFELNNRFAQANFLVTPFLVPLPISYDPYQSELERISTEQEEAKKTLEAAKLQLESDYDKELKEFIAQLDKKHELKQRELNSNFVVKTKELNEHQSAILTNKLLANACRLKCLDIKQSGRPVLQQGANGNITRHHPIPPPTQQNASRPHHNITAPPTTQQGAANGNFTQHHLIRPPRSGTQQGANGNCTPTQQNALRPHRVNGSPVPLTQQGANCNFTQHPIPPLRPHHNITVASVPERTPPTSSVQASRAIRPLVGSLSYSSTEPSSSELRSFRPPHLRGASVPQLPSRPQVSVEIPAVPNSLPTPDTLRSTERGSVERSDDVVCLSDDD